MPSIVILFTDIPAIVIPDVNYLQEAVFDPANGQIRALKTWDISADKITLVRGEEILVEKRVPQPPDEVLNLLNHNPDL